MTSALPGPWSASSIPHSNPRPQAERTAYGVRSACKHEHRAYTAHTRRRQDHAKPKIGLIPLQVEGVTGALQLCDCTSTSCHSACALAIT
eukprot:scaffold7070_cov125-Isochrysis_galbana.AAC.1